MRAYVIIIYCVLELIIGIQKGFAQKEDRVWCFGVKCGIDFNNVDTPTTFLSDCWNSAIAASISDSSGKLLFYLASNPSNTSAYRCLIRNGNHEVITNGDSLQACIANYDGLKILPFTNDPNKFYLFYIGDAINNGPQCDGIACHCQKLFYSIIEKMGDTLRLTEKNTLLLDSVVDPRLGAIRHGNGNDWWLLAHESYYTNACSNKFYRYLVDDQGIHGPFIQNAGNQMCNRFWEGAQLVFSPNGNRVASIIGEEGKVDLFDFDRCNGELKNLRQILQLTQPAGIRGCAFSSDSRFLYVARMKNDQSIGTPYNSLMQYDMTTANVQGTAQVIWTDTGPYYFGELALAPDNKIYLTSYRCQQCYDQYSRNLGVIHYPDSAGNACDFRAFSFYLGDSVRTSHGLPKIPNYHLGALSIYQADAGEDTIVICSEDTTVKGVILGTLAVAGVSYTWYPADSLNYNNIAQPFAFPTVSGWYYVTLTDTSIKYSCQSRTDSVFVEVKNCSVGIREAFKQQVFDIYPNPANETLYILLTNPHYQIQTITITDISGKEVLHSAQTTISLASLSRGLYFVRVELENGESAVRKIVVR